MVIYASSEGSGESAHLHRLVWAIVTVPKSHGPALMVIYASSEGSLEFALYKGLSEPSSQYQNLMVWL